MIRNSKLTIGLFVLIFSLPQKLWSQTGNYSLKIDSAKPLRIEYRSSAWNKKADATDRGWLLFRDAGSGRLARIEMAETEANSGVFWGSYQISFQADADVLPEIYFVPQKMQENPEQMKRINSFIKDGTLLKKPFFLHQMGRTLQIISVYDTREEAVRAYQEFKLHQPIVDKSALETQARQKMLAEQQKMAQKAQEEMAERQKMEAEEKRKRDELIKKQAEMDEAEKAKRKKEAKDLIAKAMELYKKEKYVEAEVVFQKATELDPENSGAYFPYGVTLYKNEKFNRSLVALNLAKGPEVNPTERDYFMALDHMKLKEFDPALNKFNSVKSKDDKALSPAASFFAGVLEFQKENYDVAKTDFEYTIDKSSDPKLDQQAEAYIEQIANIKMFQLMRSKKYILGFNMGLSYDSNILSTAAASSPTSLNGIRGSYGGSFEYRPVYSEHHEFSSTLTVSDMYSWDTSFQPKTEFQNTDPLIANLSFPYKFKDQMFGKGYMLTLTPAFENTYMNVSESKSGVGIREQILGSAILRADNVFIMNEDYFASYSLELRNDNSMIDAADDDNQSANKLTLATSHTHFKDKKKTEASIYDGSVIYNLAKGKNQKFLRLDAGMSYTMPWINDVTVNGRAGLYSANYPDSSTSRADSGIMLNAGMRKPLSESWFGVVNLTFQKQNSNVDANVYDKYVIMTGVTYSGMF